MNIAEITALIIAISAPLLAIIGILHTRQRTESKRIETEAQAALEAVKADAQAHLETVKADAAKVKAESQRELEEVRTQQAANQQVFELFRETITASSEREKAAAARDESSRKDIHELTSAIRENITIQQAGSNRIHDDFDIMVTQFSAMFEVMNRVDKRGDVMVKAVENTEQRTESTLRTVQQLVSDMIEQARTQLSDVGQVVQRLEANIPAIVQNAIGDMGKIVVQQAQRNIGLYKDSISTLKQDIAAMNTTLTRLELLVAQRVPEITANVQTLPEPNNEPDKKSA